MGMAASQVRLLALTDRLHDIERKSQQILAQKLALGTQKDALYNSYCDALEATNYSVAFRNENGTARYVDATYQNLCSYNPERMRQQYALTDTRTGNVLVSQDEARVYEKYENDKFAFAMAMMGLEDGFGTEKTGGNLVATKIGLNATADINNDTTYLSYKIDPDKTGELSEEELYILDAVLGTDDNYADDIGEYENETDTDEKVKLAEKIRTSYGELANKILETDAGNNVLKGDGNDVLMTEAEFRAYLNADDSTRDRLNAHIDDIYSSDCTDQQREFEDFRIALYAELGEEIFAQMNNIAGRADDAKFDEQEFKFYVNKWEAIDQAGGCEVVDARYEAGDEGREWLENMVKAGLIVIQECDYQGNWQDTSIATSTNGNYLMEDKDDANLKQAEAEYEHELDIIDRKETKMDNELAKLETERKAITTEMDSLKTVKDDNIDRTFGIFG